MIENEVVLTIRRSRNINVCPRVVYVHYVIDNVCIRFIQTTLTCRLMRLAISFLVVVVSIICFHVYFIPLLLLIIHLLADFVTRDRLIINLRTLAIVTLSKTSLVTFNNESFNLVR